MIIIIKKKTYLIIFLLLLIMLSNNITSNNNTTVNIEEYDIRNFYSLNIQEVKKNMSKHENYRITNFSCINSTYMQASTDPVFFGIIMDNNCFTNNNSYVVSGYFYKVKKIKKNIIKAVNSNYTVKNENEDYFISANKWEYKSNECILFETKTKKSSKIVDILVTLNGTLYYNNSFLKEKQVNLSYSINDDYIFSDVKYNTEYINKWTWGKSINKNFELKKGDIKQFLFCPEKKLGKPIKFDIVIEKNNKPDFLLDPVINGNYSADFNQDKGSGTTATTTNTTVLQPESTNPLDYRVYDDFEGSSVNTSLWYSVDTVAAIISLNTSIKYAGNKSMRIKNAGQWTNAYTRYAGSIISNVGTFSYVDAFDNGICDVSIDKTCTSDGEGAKTGGWTTMSGIDTYRYYENSKFGVTPIEGNFFLLLDSQTPNSEQSIKKTFTDMKGCAEAFVYQNSSDTKHYGFFGLCRTGANCGDIQTQIGVYTGNSATNIVVRDSGFSFVDTGIARASTWKKFKFCHNGTKIMYFIDEQNVYNDTTPVSTGGFGGVLIYGGSIEASYGSGWTAVDNLSVWACAVTDINCARPTPIWSNGIIDYYIMTSSTAIDIYDSMAKLNTSTQWTRLDATCLGCATNGKIYKYDSAAWSDTTFTYSPDIWYHVTQNLIFSLGTWKTQNITYGNNFYSFSNPATSALNYGLGIDLGSSTNYYVYIDNVRIENSSSFSKFSSSVFLSKSFDLGSVNVTSFLFNISEVGTVLCNVSFNNGTNYINNLHSENNSQWINWSHSEKNKLVYACALSSSNAEISNLDIIFKHTLEASNNIPTISTPIFNQTTYYGYQNMKISFNYNDTDEDNGSVYIKWYKVGTGLIYTDTQTSIVSNSIVTSILNQINFTKGDIINISAYANDGEDNSTVLWSIQKTIFNSNVTITSVYSISAQSLTSCGQIIVSFRFNATDLDGVTDINTTTSKVQLTKAGEATRSSISCTNPYSTEYIKTFRCNSTFYFYDGDGLWLINSSVKDNSNVYTENITQTFTVNTLTSVYQDANSVSWSSVKANTNDNEANDSIILTNCGNQNFNQISIVGYNLSYINYQELANQKWQTDYWTNPTKTYDSNWSSFGNYNVVGAGYIYLNYTVPLGTLNTSLWQVKDDCGTRNLSLNNICWNNSIMKFRVMSFFNDTSNTYKVDWECFNLSTFSSLYTCGGIGVPSTRTYVYEEALWWKIDISGKSIPSEVFSVDDSPSQTTGQTYLNISGNPSIYSSLILNKCTSPCSSNSTDILYFYLDTPNVLSNGNYNSENDWLFTIS